MREERGTYRPPGRPRTPDEDVERARGDVRGVLERMGYGVGERKVLDELAGRVSRALVRRVLRELKAEHRSRRRTAEEEQRVHVDVRARNVLWSVDATHLGRDASAAKVMGEIVREVASTATLAVSVGPVPKARDVVQLLDRALEATGEAPLVLAADGGSENKGEVNAWCAKHGVVRLWSRPHTPTDNPWVEHGNGELKAECELGKGVRIESAERAARALVAAIERVDGARPRSTRAGRTAREAYRALPSVGSLIDRVAFQEAAACAIEEAVQGCICGRARRAAVREAVLQTMERFEVITRTRGRVS